jgi:hypothetical protein
MTKVRAQLDALLKEHPPHLQDAYEVCGEAELGDGTIVDEGTIVCEDCCFEISDVMQLDGLEGVNTQAQCDLCGADIHFSVTYTWARNLIKDPVPDVTTSEQLHHLSNALDLFSNPRIAPDLDEGFLPQFISAIDAHLNNHQP